MTERAEFYLKGRPFRDKAYHLKGVGLPNVYLRNGVSIDIDAHYGKLITIEDTPGLHHAIGLHIVTKPDEMTGPELRFLRKQMRLTQEALAQRLRINVQTVANYEKGKTGMAAAETAVRAMYALHILPPEAQASLVRNFVDGIMASRPGTKLSEQSRRRIAGSWREAGQRKAAA
jgi:transcriptional regulator with XRE-family HTH domain